ncbi:hypothetical protein [Actinacidiphila acidipaludis]|uniref:Uncharacterized protein n=1 Tax=Actinacidiphila acidipaludis TaxID=2873382 RepID=A0ABS7QFH2_9ACTN|nr:hypothetical protein [Streptomyces acidipaludis]MBY8881892.1 hypothetical protein [Streptomyces acidipaludis]
MTTAPTPNARWTKDRLGAALAATTGFFVTLPPALEVTTHLFPDYAHTTATFVGLAVATLAYRLGLRAMRRLP